MESQDTLPRKRLLRYYFKRQAIEHGVRELATPHGPSVVRAELFATSPDETWINRLIEDIVSYHWKRRRFWRAALIRSITDPRFWAPLRNLGHQLADNFVARISRQAGRALTPEEETNVRFALQLVLGAINNAIINRPGPVLLGQQRFVDNLTRAFRLVSDYDRLVGEQPPHQRAGSGRRDEGSKRSTRRPAA